MIRRALSSCLVLSLLLLAACGPVRRVSQPAVSIQQLTVNADGSWKVDLRLQNYSSIPMRFDTLRLEVSAGEQPGGTLQGSAGLSIGPESADVVTLPFAPSSAARIIAADALASRGTLAYRLQGTVEVTPEDGKPRPFEVDTRNSLNPVPGLDGVLR